MGRHKKILFWVLVLFSATLLSHGKFIGQGDEPHYLMIAHSLWFDRDLELTNNYADRNNIVYAGNLKPENHLIQGKNGCYSVHSFGLPLIFLPIFGAGYQASSSFSETTLDRLHLTRWTFLRLLIALSMVVLTATLATQIYQSLVQKWDSRVSFMTVLICFLSIPLLPLGFLFFTEMLAAFLVFTAFKFITHSKQSSPARWLACGICIAYLPFLHVKYYLISIVLLILLWAYTRGSRVQIRHAYLISIMFLAGQLIMAWINFSCFGTIMPFAAYGDIPLRISMISRGLLGLFLDQEFGLLWFSPIYLLAPAGLLAMFKEAKYTVLQYLLLAGSIIAICATYPMWWGGWSPAARFLTPAVIFFIPAVATAMSLMMKAKGLLRISCLLIVCVQAALAIIFWINPKLMWNYAWGQSYLHSKLFPGYTHNLPSLIVGSARDIQLAVLYVLIFAGLTAFLYWGISRQATSNRQDLVLVREN